MTIDAADLAKLRANGEAMFGNQVTHPSKGVEPYAAMECAHDVVRIVEWPSHLEWGGVPPYTFWVVDTNGERHHAMPNVAILGTTDGYDLEHLATLYKKFMNGLIGLGEQMTLLFHAPPVPMSNNLASKDNLLIWTLRYVALDGFGWRAATEAG